MAEAETELPELEIDEDLWVELEVPYGKVQEKWDQRYKAELEENVEKGRIGESILRTYAVLLDLDYIESVEVLLQEILAQDQRLGYNLMCLKLFSDYKSLGFFKSFQKFLYRSCEGTELHEYYRKAWDADDKIALTGLLQLFDPEGGRLKSIHALDYCDRKKPRTVSTDSELGKFDLSKSAEEIVAEVQSRASRNYQKWHAFEYDGQQYVLIKREVGDDVERQVVGNIEEEPATFVALRHTDGVLEIISEQMSVANTVRKGVNRSVEGVDFETEDPRATTEDIRRTTEDFLDEETFQTRLEKSATDIEPDRLTVIGVKLSSSPLPGHPSLQMKSEEGIAEAIRALRQVDYDLLESIDDIDVIYTRFDGREYSIRPKQHEVTEGKVRWKFTYDARQPPRHEREAFARLITDAFDIDLVFERA